MDRRIEELKQENGVRIALLSKDGIPIYYPTLFVSMELKRVSTSRQRSMLYAIEVLLNWCELENINLEERFKQGIHLNELEIRQLIDFCAWNVETQTKLINGSKLLPNSYQQVSRHMSYDRIHTIRKYLSFLYLRLAKNKDKESLTKSIDKTFKSYKPSIKKHQKNKIVSISNEQIDAIINKLLPDHPENPWTDKTIQLRNLLIFTVFYETGIRRGELAGLYVSDIKGSELSIYRRHNNPLETRSQAPNTKTAERTIPIPDSLAVVLDDYIMNHRSSIKAAKKHPYLFVSHRRNKGNAMSLNAINEVFKTARSALPELKDITPHKLRHHMNYRISEMIDREYENASPADKAQIDEDTRSYLMGWSPNGNMQQTYNKRYFIKKAGEMILGRSEKLNKRID